MKNFKSGIYFFASFYTSVTYKHAYCSKADALNIYIDSQHIYSHIPTNIYQVVIPGIKIYIKLNKHKIIKRLKTVVFTV